jgi:hypothetical protein
LLPTLERAAIGAIEETTVMRQPATPTRPAGAAEAALGQDSMEPVAPVLTIEERDERQRHDRIATAAYFLASARGFVPGRELDDWLAAELAEEQGRVSTGN